MNMLRFALTTSIALASCVFAGPSAYSSLVTSGLQQYTASGSSYSFSQMAAPAAIGGGTLTFDGVGDFNEKLEFVTISVNGTNFIASRFLPTAPGFVPNPNSTYVITGVQGSVFSEVKLDQLRTVYTLSAGQINSLIAAGGGNLNIQVQFERRVGAPLAANGLPVLGSFSTTTLAYTAVPEPASLALAALALGVLGVRRAKKVARS